MNDPGSTIVSLLFGAILGAGALWYAYLDDEQASQRERLREMRRAAQEERLAHWVGIVRTQALSPEESVRLLRLAGYGGDAYCLIYHHQGYRQVHLVCPGVTEIDLADLVPSISSANETTALAVPAPIPPQKICHIRLDTRHHVRHNVTP